MIRTIGLVSTNYSVEGFEELFENRCAAALPFGGRYRLVDFALSNLINGGVRTVGVITPYSYRSLLDHIGAGKAWGLDRKSGGLFVLPGSPYGSADENRRFSLEDFRRNRQYLEQGDADYVLCTDCGFLYNADYRLLMERHEVSGADVTLLYKPLREEQRRGVYLTLDEKDRVCAMERAESGERLFLNCFMVNRGFLLRLLDAHEQPAFESPVFRHRPPRDFTELLAELLTEAKVEAMAFEGSVLYANSIGDYFAASRSLLRRELRQELFAAERQIYTHIHDEPPTAFGKNAEVRNSVISSGSHMGGEVENSVLFRGVTVEEGATVKNCVLMEKTVICAGAVLENVICDKQVTVSGGVVLRGTADNPCLLRKGKSI